ncbi:hypothetical protein CYMTET_34170 [Cymbomonas tetramitiformis]|uniref:Uncharacterized protein n=1 Tax=Cymbomonas tetramitiformis TaxID=36881 RepID=A0AAE0FC34_9CHLO|nr:hypothetical protein CYMTET_34170 [Cymbomonas tetramitiformis]
MTSLYPVDPIALPPSPNWYGSHLSDWGYQGRLVAIAAHNLVVLLRPDEICFEATLAGHTNRVTAVAFVKLLNSNHLLISGSADRTLRVWDTVTRQQTQILRGHNAEVTALATSSQIADAVLSGDKDGHLLSWRFSSGERCAASKRLGDSAILCIAINPAKARGSPAPQLHLP